MDVSYLFIKLTNCNIFNNYGIKCINYNQSSAA
jgi:hypothetical protein